MHHALVNELTHRLGNVRVDTICLGSDFVTHGSVEELYRNHGIDGASVAEFIREVQHNEN